MTKQLVFDEQTRKKILSGISQMAGAVKITLCSNGSNVIIDKKFGAPSTMKDGVTVVKEVEIKDPIKNKDLKMGKEVASKKLKSITSGVNSVFVKHDIEMTVDAAVVDLVKTSKKVEDDKIPQITKVPANQDEKFEKIITGSMKLVVKDSKITIEEDKTNGASLKIILHN